ncbi:hypothetical protein VTK56DRAFT_7160 [Thermocarpiscus australiensis]
MDKPQLGTPDNAMRSPGGGGEIPMRQTRRPEVSEMSSCLRRSMGAEAASRTNFPRRAPERRYLVGNQAGHHSDWLPVLAPRSRSRSQRRQSCRAMHCIGPAPSKGRDRSLPSHQNQAAIQGQGVQQNSGVGPFMHYEDLDHFEPEPGSEHKDESQVDGVMPRADTFPSIP